MASYRMSSLIHSHRDLIALQMGMKLRTEVRGIVLQLPKPDCWDIGRQASRAALAIPALIAEGHGRPGREDYKNYLSMSHGEGAELDTELLAMVEDHPRLRPRVDVAFDLLDQTSRLIMAIYKKL